MIRNIVSPPRPADEREHILSKDPMKAKSLQGITQVVCHLTPPSPPFVKAKMLLGYTNNVKILWLGSIIRSQQKPMMMFLNAGDIASLIQLYK
jgi:hypothetical protein